MKPRTRFAAILLTTAVAGAVVGREPPDELEFHFDREFKRAFSSAVMPPSHYVIQTSIEQDVPVLSRLSLCGRGRTFSYDRNGRTTDLVDGFSIAYRELHAGQAFPILGRLYRVQGIECDPEGRRYAAGLTKLKADEIPEGVPQPLDAAAIPVGASLHARMGRKVIEDGRRRSVWRYGPYTPSVNFRLEKITPGTGEDDGPAAHITAWLSFKGNSGLWDEKYRHYRVKPREYRASDEIRMAIGGVRLKVASIVPADSNTGKPGVVHLRQGGRSSERHQTRRTHVDDEETTAVGKSGEIASIRVEVSAIRVSEAEGGKSTSVDLKAWADPEGKWFPQEFPQLHTGSSFIVYRNYCSYRVHGIVPSNPEHNIVGWVELTPMPDPLDDAPSPET